MRLLLGISGPYRVAFDRRRWVALLMIGVFIMTVESSPTVAQSRYDNVLPSRMGRASAKFVPRVEWTGPP